MSNFPRTCRSLWIEGKGHAVIRERPLGRPGRSDVVVRSLYSGVSRGTECLVYSGNVPPSVAAEMRAPHQEGDFPWPVKYGYCSVGRVVHGPAELIQRRVFCLYPHQDFYVVDSDQVHLLPSGLDAERAILGANMETALNAVWDANIKAGDKVSVVGAGVVGSLVAFLAAGHPGVEVELVDVDASREQVARSLGLSFREPAAASEGADVVVHASGQPAGLRTALRLAGLEAAIVELSWYGGAPVELPLGQEFHPRRLRIIGSQVGRLPSFQSARWTHQRRLRKALELCLAPQLDVLISSEGAFSELPQTLRVLADEGGLCHRVRYD